MFFTNNSCPNCPLKNAIPHPPQDTLQWLVLEGAYVETRGAMETIRPHNAHPMDTERVIFHLTTHAALVLSWVRFHRFVSTSPRRHCHGRSGLWPPWMTPPGTCATQFSELIHPWLRIYVVLDRSIFLTLCPKFPIQILLSMPMSMSSPLSISPCHQPCQYPCQQLHHYHPHHRHIASHIIIIHVINHVIYNDVAVEYVTNMNPHGLWFFLSQIMSLDLVVQVWVYSMMV